MSRNRSPTEKPRKRGSPRAWSSRLQAVSPSDIVAIAAATVLAGVAVWTAVLFLSVTPATGYLIGHARTVIAIVDQLSLAVRTAEAAGANYRLSGEEEQRQLYDASSVEIPTRLDDLFRLTADDPAQQDRLRYLADLLRTEQHALATGLNVDRRGGHTQAPAELVDPDISTSIRDTLDAIRREELQNLDRRRDSYVRARLVEQWLVFACLAGLAGLGAVAWMLARLRGRERNLIRTLDLGAFMVRDLDGTIRFWSAGCTQIYRWTATEAVGRRSHDLLRTIFPIPQGEIDSVLRDGREWSGYLSHEDRDGRRILVFSRMVLRRSGRQEDVLESISDVTSQREAEMLLAETAARLDLAIKVGQIGLSDWNLQTGAFVCNERMRDIWALPPDAELAAETFSSALSPADRLRHQSLIAEAARGDAPRVYEGEFIVAGLTDGVARRVWLRGEVEPAGGEPARVVQTAVDITVQREAEAVLGRDKLALEALVAARTEALERAQEHLARTSRFEALAQFVAGVAHHFNNLLHAVLASSDLIAERTEDPRAVRRLAGTIADAALRGHDITNRLMAFARQNRLHNEEIAVGPFLAKMKDVLTRDLALTVTIEISVAEHVPHLRADGARLEAVLIGLARNADEAMSGDGILRLTATERRVGPDEPPSRGLPPPGRYVCIAIADTGIGMDSATLSRVAEPFFSTKEFGSSLGLGLAMSHGFLAQSGGAMSIESALGKGTTVRLWFPVVEDVIRQAALSMDARVGVIGPMP